MSFLSTSLRRSSPFISRGCGSPRLYAVRCLSTIAGTNFPDSEQKGPAIRVYLRSVSGLVLASGLGLWFWCSSSPGSSHVSFADFSSPAGEIAVEDQADQRRLERKTRYLFGDSYRRRVFFKYEKRIRTQSPPEKVFEYFASYMSPNGEILMTPADFMRAVVPVFPPSESNIVREGYLRGEWCPGDLRCATSSFFMLFDTNNDGLISFSEYIFFVTLLSIPETSFSVAFKMFDLDHNGEIQKDEFKKVMALMRTYNRQGACHSDGWRNRLKIGASVENGGLLEHFFGKDGNQNLQHEKFVEFLKDLHNEIVRLEFAHYDYKSRGTISAKDFALSMVASADISHINRFLDLVEKMNDDHHFADMQITFEEFKAFAELRKKLKPLALAIFGFGKVNGLLTKKDFQRAASHVCGISLTDNMVDVIFHVFDASSDGNLSSEEFLRVLQKRERDMAYPSGTSLSWLISCCLNCAKTSSSYMFQ